MPNYKLLPKQKELFEIPHDNQLDVCIYQGGYGSGKTWCGSLLGLMLAIKYPGSKGLVGIYLTPRNYKTDNYTIPDWVAWLAGNKSKWDVRPSHLHDFGCQYHQLIRVKLNERGLRKLRYLRVYNDKLVCEDIPVKFLELIPITKWEVDCLFKRAMKAAKVIPARIYNLFRCGVFFNFGWLGNHPAYDLNKIYEK